MIQGMLNEKQNKTILSQQWVNKDSLYYQYLKLENNCIEAIQTNAHIYGAKVLKGIFKFSLKFDTHDKGITIGIISDASRKMWNNTYVFYQSHGKICENGQIASQCQSFSQLGIFSVIGNLNEGTIKFLRNDVVFYSHQSQILKNKEIEWVPFVGIFKNSRIQIVQSFNNIEAQQILLS